MDISNISKAETIGHINSITESTGYKKYVKENTLRNHPSSLKDHNPYFVYNLFVVSQRKLFLYSKWAERNLLTFLNDSDSPLVIEDYLKGIIKLFEPNEVSSDALSLPKMLKNIFQFKKKLNDKFNKLHVSYDFQQAIVSFYPDGTEMSFWLQLPNGKENESFVDDRGQLFASAIHANTDVNMMWLDMELDKYINNWSVRSVFEDSNSIGRNRKPFLKKFEEVIAFNKKDGIISKLNFVSNALNTTFDDVLINSTVERVDVPIHSTSSSLSIHYWKIPSGLFTYLSDAGEIIADNDPVLFKRKLLASLHKVIAANLEESINI